MAAVQDDDSNPTVRFKRRKVAHPKRTYLEDDVATTSTTVSADPATSHNATSSLKEDDHDKESVPNLKEILRNRKRPRDRIRENARKTEAPSTELVQAEASRPDRYTSRFIAQTGQVVDRDDKQMTEYVEARMAEKNYRQYGWPIPTNLQSSVAAIAPDLKHTFGAIPSKSAVLVEAETPTDVEHSNRLAAGQGKLQEVEIGPKPAVPVSKARRDKYGYGWRNPKRRNSEDLRRDQMVEAVLREAKLDFFDESAPTNPHANSSGNNDDAIAERFQIEYMESMEEARQQRKPAPPAGGIKGAKEAPKGPKLGGSKSARARILKAQEEEKKTGKR